MLGSNSSASSDQSPKNRILQQSEKPIFFELSQEIIKKQERYFKNKRKK